MQGQRRRRARRRQRGMMLVEILIVVAIITLIATGVGLSAFDAWKKARIKTATTNAVTIRAATKSWWTEHDSGVCPTVAQLIVDRTLDEGASPDDPWGSPFRIECTGDRVAVASAGPDRQQGTPDDIRVPPLSS